MNETRNSEASNGPVSPSRRRILEAAGAGVVAATLGGLSSASAEETGSVAAQSLRWGIVGTGMIANSLAPRIIEAEGATLSAVCSRKMETAREFADKFDVPKAFDSWEQMLASETIDAVYVATPTSVREEISVAAATRGKHVLAEKPFANLPSLQRIVAACRDNGVAFMDGTHFPHLERTKRIRADMTDLVGRPWSVASAFQFYLDNPANIRLRPDLEPYGAIGDTGWYNMRAAVEFLPDDVELVAADAWMQRDEASGACVSGSGVLRFSDGSTSTWNCGFLSGAGVQDLRVTGREGVLWMDDFVGARGNERFRYHQGRREFHVDIPFSKQQATSMFEDFARMVGDPDSFEASARASERTQAWLDAVWLSAVANEGGS